MAPLFFSECMTFSFIGRKHLTAKTMRAFDLIYKQHFNEYDWFLKADDDTYVIMENVRYLLSKESPREPVFFGHHYRPHVAQGNTRASYTMSLIFYPGFHKPYGSSYPPPSCIRALIVQLYGDHRICVL